jgi:hypothetical protein
MIFGVEIELSDMQNTVSADSNFGIYNRTDTLSADPSVGDYTITVTDGTIFSAHQRVYITDGTNSETNVIDSISGNDLTLQNALSYDFAIGDTVRQNSVIRLVQNELLAGTSDRSWTSGLIKDNGMDKFTREIDLRRGGNVSKPGKFKVTLINTNKFSQELKDRNINLNGRPIRVHKYDV